MKTLKTVLAVLLSLSLMLSFAGFVFADPGADALDGFLPVAHGDDSELEQGAYYFIESYVNAAEWTDQTEIRYNPETLELARIENGVVTIVSAVQDGVLAPEIRFGLKRHNFYPLFRVAPSLAEAEKYSYYFDVDGIKADTVAALGGDALSEADRAAIMAEIDEMFATRAFEYDRDTYSIIVERYDDTSGKYILRDYNKNWFSVSIANVAALQEEVERLATLENPTELDAKNLRLLGNTVSLADAMLDNLHFRGPDDAEIAALVSGFTRLPTRPDGLAPDTYWYNKALKLRTSNENFHQMLDQHGPHYSDIFHYHNEARWADTGSYWLSDDAAVIRLIFPERANNNWHVEYRDYDAETDEYLRRIGELEGFLPLAFGDSDELAQGDYYLLQSFVNTEGFEEGVEYRINPDKQMIAVIAGESVRFESYADDEAIRPAVYFLRQHGMSAFYRVALNANDAGADGYYFAVDQLKADALQVDEFFEGVDPADREAEIDEILATYSFVYEPSTGYLYVERHDGTTGKNYIDGVFDAAFCREKIAELEKIQTPSEDERELLEDLRAKLAVTNVWLANIVCAAYNKEDQLAANRVIILIDNLPRIEYNHTVEALLGSARTAYDELTAAQKALVTNLDKLTAAEAEFLVQKEIYEVSHPTDPTEETPEEPAEEPAGDDSSESFFVRIWKNVRTVFERFVLFLKNLFRR